MIGLATVTGCVGGIYGIGGGAVLAPILIGSGRRPAEVAPAALASTFVTSLGGVLTFTLLSISKGPVAPIRVWGAGCASGEEACSVAMLLAEALGTEMYRARVKIYQALSKFRHQRDGRKNLR